MFILVAPHEGAYVGPASKISSRFYPGQTSAAFQGYLNF